MLDLKHVTMTTEAIVTLRGYGFCPEVILTASVEPSSPVENDVREPDYKQCRISTRLISFCQYGKSVVVVALSVQ